MSAASRLKLLTVGLMTTAMTTQWEGGGNIEEAAVVVSIGNGSGGGGSDRGGRRSSKDNSRIKLKSCHNNYTFIGSDGTLALIF